MNLKIEMEANVTDFHPATPQDEFVELLHRRLTDMLSGILKDATERTGLIPLKNDLHLTGKTWEGTAKIELTVSPIDDPPTEVEKTYDTPRTI